MRNTSSVPVPPCGIVVLPIEITKPARAGSRKQGQQDCKAPDPHSSWHDGYSSKVSRRPAGQLPKAEDLAIPRRWSGESSASDSILSQAISHLAILVSKKQHDGLSLRCRHVSSQGEARSQLPALRPCRQRQVERGHRAVAGDVGGQRRPARRADVSPMLAAISFRSLLSTIAVAGHVAQQPVEVVHGGLVRRAA